MQAPLRLFGLKAVHEGRQVLGPLDLQLEPGEFVAVIGSSGAGKTTLLELVRSAYSKEGVWLPQAAGLVDNLTVFHNIFMGQLNRQSVWSALRNLIRPDSLRVNEIRSILAELGLEHKIWAPAGQLSGGQRQRVAVGRALYQRPGLLLADEPVSALDGPRAKSVMARLRESFPTALVAMHDVELALQFADRILGIRAGHIVLDTIPGGVTGENLQSLYQDARDGLTRTGTFSGHSTKL